MSGPLSKAPPPPPTPAQRAQRRRQIRLVLGTLVGIVVVVASWQVFEYIDSAPERAEQQVNAGIAMLTPGRYGEAVQQFTEALQLNSASWNAYLQRGVAKQNLGQLDAALDDYQKALLLKPDLLKARTERAEIYRRKGDSRNALEELTKVIEIEPTTEAYTTRGLVRADLGQHQEAIADFSWVIEKLRDAPYAYLGRARSKRALGDEAGAQADEKMTATFNRR